MLRINSNMSYTSPNFKGLSIGPGAARMLDKVGALQSPGQRLAFGVAALVLHPVMDKLNPWIDEETKKTSAVRSAAKAIACTTTGVIIREACILGTNAILESKKLASKIPEFMKQNKNHTAAVIGTLMGLGIMMFTNFLIDVPLTDKLTHLFTKKMNSKNNTGSDKIQTPAPSFNKNTKEQMHSIKEKIDKGELPPMSQVNMQVIKWA